MKCAARASYLLVGPIDGFGLAQRAPELSWETRLQALYLGKEMVY